jgi:hypothetical protein
MPLISAAAGHATGAWCSQLSVDPLASWGDEMAIEVRVSGPLPTGHQNWGLGVPWTNRTTRLPEVSSWV